MHKTVSATEARKQWFKLLEKAAKSGEKVTITREGHAPVIMMSEEEYEGWLETLEIMSDPDLVKSIRQGMKEKGGITLEALQKKYNL